MATVTITDVHQAEETYMKLKAAYDALEKPIPPRVLNERLDELKGDTIAHLSRIERIEKILLDLDAKLCASHGLQQSIPF